MISINCLHFQAPYIYIDNSNIIGGIYLGINQFLPIFAFFFNQVIKQTDVSTKQTLRPSLAKT